MSTDELDDYEHNVDHDEALVSELDDERMLSDGDELADADGERDTTPFDDTRCIYTGVIQSSSSSPSPRTRTRRRCPRAQPRR